MRRFMLLNRNERILFGLTLLAVLFGLAVRIWNLSFPEKQVFDEVYFPVMAKDYLLGNNVFDVHPPLGKFIIALGIWLVGDGFIGWRIMPLVFGCLLIFFMGRVYWGLTKDKIGAWILMAMVALEGILITYSRVGLMDGVLFMATVAAFYAGARIKDLKSTLIFGLIFGLAAAIKWPAAAVLPAIFWFSYRDKQVVRLLIGILIAVLVYLSIVALGEWRDGEVHFLRAILEWHGQTASYHANLTATHPWSSPWYSWPFMERPVLLIYDAVPGGLQIMNTIGNPLWWWSSSLLTFGSAIWVFWSTMLEKGQLLQPLFWLKRAWQHELTPYLLGFFAAWLPWALIGRVVFLYHYLPAYAFSLLILTYWLRKLWSARPAWVFLFLGLGFVCTIYFLPWNVGWITLTQDQVKEHTWIANWLSASRIDR